MQIQAIKTAPVRSGDNLIAFLEKYVKAMPERSVLAITSKVIALCEGSTVPLGSIQREKLIEQEADAVLPAHNRYKVTLTMKRGLLVPTAGIDESNGDGAYVLWPKNPQKSANDIRAHLSKRLKKKKLAIIITDSTTKPLHWGTVGTALSWSGMKALNDYVGKPDIFGRKLKYTQSNVAEGLAAAAVSAMGEGAERTPLAIITDVPFVSFTGNNPSTKELRALHIKPADDLYGPLLTALKWRKTKKPRSR